jgi:predicted HTH transcriptional regulator
MITRAEVDEAIQQLGMQEPVSEIARLIQRREGQFVEFKETMRYHTKAQRRDQEMDREVARALCGFMNTQGGTLIIGVDDDGRALGLEADLSTLGKKDEDGFELAFTEIVTSYLELPDRRHIKPYFEEYDCKRVYVVEVESSDEPVYCLFDKNIGHEFYIRVGNSTRKLSLKETVEYIQKHFQARISQENRKDTHFKSAQSPKGLLD